MKNECYFGLLFRMCCACSGGVRDSDIESKGVLLDEMFDCFEEILTQGCSEITMIK